MSTAKKTKPKPKTTSITKPKSTPGKMSANERMKRLRQIVAYGVAEGKSEQAIVGALRHVRNMDAIPEDALWPFRKMRTLPVTDLGHHMGWVGRSVLEDKDLPTYADAVYAYAQEPVIINLTKTYWAEAKK